MTEKDAIARVTTELKNDRLKVPPFNSPHEGYAVIQEELDELWIEIKANSGRAQSAIEEATQVAARAVRDLMDLTGKGAATQ